MLQYRISSRRQESKRKTAQAVFECAIQSNIRPTFALFNLPVNGFEVPLILDHYLLSGSFLLLPSTPVLVLPSSQSCPSLPYCVTSALSNTGLVDRLLRLTLQSATRQEAARLAAMLMISITETGRYCRSFCSIDCCQENEAVPVLRLLYRNQAPNSVTRPFCGPKPS